MKDEKEKMKLLVLNGPNLNMLGTRQRDVYGTKSYEELAAEIMNWAQESGFEATVRQSNHEGVLIDLIQGAQIMGYDALLINPGAYAHYSYAISDALRCIALPKAEVHLSDIDNREDFRKLSVTAAACDKIIVGLGFEGYRQAIVYLSKIAREH